MTRENGDTLIDWIATDYPYLVVCSSAVLSTLILFRGGCYISRWSSFLPSFLSFFYFVGLNFHGSRLTVPLNCMERRWERVGWPFIEFKLGDLSDESGGRLAKRAPHDPPRPQRLPNHSRKNQE